MRRRQVIGLCVLCCALAAALLLRPAPEDAAPLTGSASAGLILLDGQNEGYYVLAVIDQSRADRAGIYAGDTLLALDGQAPADLSAADAFFSAQQATVTVTVKRCGETMDIPLPAP